MNIKPARVAAVLALLGAFLVSGCGDSTEPSASNAGSSPSGTIKFMSLTTSQAADEDLIGRFEKQFPDVKVEAEFVAGGAGPLTGRLMTQLQGGGGPDVFVVYGGTGVSPSVTALSASRKIEDLSASQWAKDVPPLVQPLTTVDGRPHMTMLGVQAGVVVYNVDKFKELGLTAPTTWSELLSVCHSIQQRDKRAIPLAFAGGAESTAAPNLLMFASNDVYASDAKWNTTRAADGTSFAATPGWRQVFKRLVDLKSAGCLSKGVAADTVDTTVSQFASGRALMIIGPTFFANTIRAANKDLKFAIFAPPADTLAATHLTLYPSQGLAVNAASSNKAAARAFVDFMAEQGQTARWAEVNGVIAPRDFQDKKLPQYLQPLDPLVDKSVVGSYLTWPTGATFVALGKSAQGLLTGQTTIDQALADMDASWGK